MNRISSEDGVMRRRYERKEGQALVEFVLASTLIFLLLAAAVDLGFIYFALQGLHNAAQEGATYGSRWPIIESGTQNRILNAPEIRARVRSEAGDQGSSGFINLNDLNSNGLDDVDENEQVNGKPLIEEYITVQALADNDGNGRPEDQPCGNLASTVVPCFVTVTVKADYNLVFALSPFFGDQIPLQSSFTMPLRDTAAEGGISQPGMEPIIDYGPRD